MDMITKIDKDRQQSCYENQPAILMCNYETDEEWGRLIT